MVGALNLVDFEVFIFRFVSVKKCLMFDELTFDYLGEFLLSLDVLMVLVGSVPKISGQMIQLPLSFPNESLYIFIFGPVFLDGFLNVVQMGLEVYLLLFL